MRLKYRSLFLITVVMVFGVAKSQGAESPLPSPKQLWDRCQKTLPPFTYKILTDNVVTSDTDPRMKLHRLEIRFISQEINGAKMGHDAVIYMPADPKVNASPERRGKVVVVARSFSDKTLIGNYAEPIAARTGYPTMCIDIPGDKDGKEGEMPWLTGLRQLAQDTHDPIDHDLFRCAIPYLRVLDVFADVLHEKKIRAIIGGHSKRAYYAYTAAAIDPDRVASVVYMGCERLFTEDEKRPDFSVSPPFAPGEKYPRCLVLFTLQKHVKCPVFYLGATNEAGFTMFNINKLVAKMKQPWTIEYIPNYRHDARSEKQFIDWQMWVSHVFDGRPLTKISNLGVEYTQRGTTFRAKLDSPNKILQVKAWYVYCDDVPYWRDLMWYPVLMRKGQGNQYIAAVGGNPPDAWFVEVKDIARGFSGYVSSLPQNITGKPAEERNARRPRYWKLRHKQPSLSPQASHDYLEGEINRREDRRQKAIASYQKAIVADPDFAMAYWHLAMAYPQGDLSAYKKKSDALRQAMKRPDRLSARDFCAVCGDYYSMSRYRYAKAMETYKKWLQLCPSDVEAHRGLGTIYFDIEEWDKAASEFRWVIQSGSKQPADYLKLALAYINPGKYGEAERTLKECLDHNGDNVGIYLALANVYQYRGDSKAATAIVDKAISLFPEAASCLVQKGNIYLYNEQLEKAEAEYQKLLKDPRPGVYALGIYRLSELRLLQGRFEEARHLAKQGYDYARAQNKGTMRDRLSFLASLDAVTGHHEEALDKLDLLWKSTLKDEELEWQRFIVYSKGLVHAQSGRLDLAMQDARTLDELVSKGLDKKKARLTLHLLGVIELERKNYRKAAEYLEKCLPMICLRSRLNIAVVDSLASAYLGLGKPQKAKAQYERLATYPRGRQFYGNVYTLSFYHLGQCYEAQGQKAKAIEQYEKFVDVWSDADPDVPELEIAARKLAILSRGVHLP